MKFLQFLNHCEVAQSLLEQNVIEENVDMALISEQYRNKNSGEWVTSNSKKTAICSCGNPRREMCKKKCGNCFARAHVNGIAFYSCYLPPSSSLPQAISALEEIAEDARERRRAVIAGDFNAWATEWGSPEPTRGERRYLSFAALDLVLLNSGTKPTFSRSGTSSIIDLTFVNSGLASGSSWMVSDTYTGSDHAAIDSRKGPPRVPKTVPGYKIETLDVEMVQTLFEDLSTSGSAEEWANHIAEYTKVACDASMQRRRRRRIPSRRRPAYWWNQSIAEARKNCHRARRAYLRSIGRPEFEALQIYFREKRRALEKTIKESNRRCFNNICEEIYSSPWGFAYKLVTKRLRVFSRPSPTCPVSLKRIV